MAPLTPRQLIELPRPGAAQPNSAGSHAIVTLDQFEFDAAKGAGRTESSLLLLDLATGAKTTLLTGVGEAVWLDDKTVLYLRPAHVHAPDVSDKDYTALSKTVGAQVWAVAVESGETYSVLDLPVAIANLKAIVVDAASAVLAFSAVVFADGDVFKVEEHKKRQEADAQGSDARVYDGLMARHWDEWKTPGELQQLHFVRLTQNPEALSDGSFEVVDAPRVGKQWSAALSRDANAVTATGVRRPDVSSPLAGTKHECPVGPFGSSADYDLSKTHVVFHSKALHLNPAWHTRTAVFTVPFSPRTKADGITQLTAGDQGACSSPTFSHDGERVAWLEMREEGYEADRNRVMLYELETASRWGATETGFDRSPASLVWCPCGEKVYFAADDEGHHRLYELRVPLTKSAATPRLLTQKHSVAAFVPISTSKVLLTINSFTSPNSVSILDASASPTVSIPVASFTDDLVALHGLHAGEEFRFVGAEGKSIHGWILFPPGYDAKTSAKLPLAMCVHGGPEGAWTDGWSTRWNLNSYSAHGYITVAINVTGSTGYGQELTQAIRGQWGGLPFQDLVAGLEHVKAHYPVDPERMAMLGASYGGYMALWILGHNEVTKFKAIVSHDGVFDTRNTFYTTDELYFPEAEFGGTPWTAAEGYSKWNPSNHVAKWSTPTLLIHGGKDYRLVDGESIAAFNALQRLGVPSRFVYFESENHWVLSKHNSLRWHTEVLKFIDSYTAL